MVVTVEAEVPYLMIGYQLLFKSIPLFTLLCFKTSVLSLSHTNPVLCLTSILSYLTQILSYLTLILSSLTSRLSYLCHVLSYLCLVPTT
jgi:hypothetical protein